MPYSLPIETDRLTLRRYVESDYDDLLKLQSSDDVTRCLPYDAKTPEEVRESLALRLADVPLDADGQALTVAHFVQNETRRGQWTDELVFAMLADEWKQHPPSAR